MKIKENNSNETSLETAMKEIRIGNRSVKRLVKSIIFIFAAPVNHGKFSVRTTHAGTARYNGQDITVYRTEIKNNEKGFTFGARWVSHELEGKLF